MEITSKHLQDNAVTYALQNAKSNRNVKDVEVLIRDYTFGLLQVERTGRLSTLKVYIADIYILTAEKVLAIISEHPDINCIVVTSIWNSYTDMAKELAQEQNIGVFTQKEFKVALNYYGKLFLETGNPTKTE